MNFDLPVFRAINSFARTTPWLHGPLLGYSTGGVLVMAVLLLILWWTVRRRPHNTTRMAAVLWTPVATVLALGINQFLVAAVHEARPYTALPGIFVLATRSTDFSFPSDHAVMAGAVITGTLLATRGVLAWITVAAGLLLAFSRVYIAAHYPHDVVAGLAVGAVVTLVGFLLLRRPLTAAVRALHDSRLRLLVSNAAPAAPSRA